MDSNHQNVFTKVIEKKFTQEKHLDQYLEFSKTKVGFGCESFSTWVHRGVANMERF